MNRVIGFLVATGWFALISALWFGTTALSAAFLLQRQYGFDPLQPAAWERLATGFRQGQAIPLGFILLGLAFGSLGLIGEIAILWRLPTLVARLPSLSLPRLSFKPPKPPARKQRPEKSAAPTPPPPAPEPPAAEPAPPEDPQNNDSAILARILALFDVWDEPPPSWMAEALRDEVHLLSPGAWPTLESLGSHGLDLLLTLQEHGMLPESKAALQAIGEVGAVLRAGLAAEADRLETSSPKALLTLAASWLCEALENFLAAAEDARVDPEQLAMARTMLKQAMGGMSEEDWASLDQFPEKASRVRVLTDRLREELRDGPPVKSLKPVDSVIALLERFGFTVEAGTGAAEAPFLAQRPDLLLLLRIFDLGDGAWRLPQGLLGPWSRIDQTFETSPGRQLWQLMARRRLRQPDPRPLTGLLVLRDGRVEEEKILAELVAADRRRSLISLAWLEESDGPLPSLERELRDLTERTARERSLQRADSHSAAP